ncbi:MAG: carboxymuconolactone decarboxylase family protein [Myxococcota bacterium]
MKQRLPLSAFPKPALGGMVTLDKHLHATLDRKLHELLNLRVSQLNGCAYCIDMHYKEARNAGESEQRLYGLAAWREAPYYSDKERAALAWAEAVTKLDDDGLDEALWNEVRDHLSVEEVSNLTVAIIAINGWNRWNIAMRTEAGRYEVGMFG